MVLALLPFPPNGAHPLATATGIFLILGIFLAIFTLPFRTISPWFQALPGIVYIVAIAFLRHAEGGFTSGFVPLMLLPVLWIALYGRPVHIATTTVVMVASLMIPILVFGSPDYPSSEWRRVLVMIAVSASAGPVAYSLMERLRQNSQRLEQQSRALTAAAEVAHSFTSEEDTRVATCRAMTEIADAAFTVLTEPDGTGNLVATASYGAVLPPIRIPIEGAGSGASAAFRDGRRLIVDDPASDPRAANELAKRTGASMTLYEPVRRAGESVGVFTIAWTKEAVRPSDIALQALELLAGEAAIALERASMLAALDELARTDELTGLPNRRVLSEYLEREIARTRRSGAPLALAMLDLDNFKDYNDTYGHQAGDRLLQDAAKAWGVQLRPNDLLARYGGEEFVVLLPDCPMDVARTVVDRLRAATPDGQTCSAGLAAWQEGFGSIHLLGQADKALYAAKQAGRNRTSLPPETT